MTSDGDDFFKYQFQRLAVRVVAEDARAKEARRQMCGALAVAFEAAGEYLLTIGHIFGSGRVDGTSAFGNGDDRLVGLGHLSTTARSLILGTVELLEHRNTYAASALTRQLVEVEYLSWAFAEDLDEAASWLRSDRQERLKRWQPRHLRDRSNGRFRGADYSEHCEIGGHPSPQGIRALIAGCTDQTIELLFTEAALHGTSAWNYTLAAVSDYCGRNQLAEMPLPDGVAEAVITAAAAWDEHHDHLASTWNFVARSR